MISVQNLLRPLNGSNWLIIFLVFSFLLASCSGSRDIPRTSRNNERTSIPKNNRKRNVSVDTVQWTEVSEEVDPPIVSDEGIELIKKSSYNIAIALPFEASNYQSESVNDRFIQFYAGFQMAMDVLDEEGVKLQLTAIDTEGREKVIREKLANLEADLLIGPYERNCLAVAADWAKENKTPMVSPWVASNRITQDNPYYIQLRPSVRDHYDAIVDEVLSNYRPEQVIILKRFDGKDDGKVKYIQDYAAAILETSGKAPFQEFGIEEDSLILGETYMMDLISRDEPTVFISQNYLFEEDEYVYNTLRKLSAVKGENEVFVYGMPLILDMDKINFSLYKLLNVSVARFRYIDLYADDIKYFRTDFLKRYHTLPDDEAYFGYDVGYYFGKAINKYGIGFQNFLDQNQEISLLSSRYDIQKTFADDKVSDDFKDVNFLANKYVEIVKFIGDKFQVKKN